MMNMINATIKRLIVVFLRYKVSNYIYKEVIALFFTNNYYRGVNNVRRY